MHAHVVSRSAIVGRLPVVRNLEVNHRCKQVQAIPKGIVNPLGVPGSLLLHLLNCSGLAALTKDKVTEPHNLTNNSAAIFTVANTVGTTTNYLDVGAATNVPAFFYRVRLVP